MSLMSMPDEYVDGKVDMSVLRRRTDDIDQRVIELLHARRDVSQQVLRTRTDVGGPRIEPVREAESPRLNGRVRTSDMGMRSHARQHVRLARWLPDPTPRRRARRGDGGERGGKGE